MSLFLLFSFFLSPSDLWRRSGVDSCLHSAAAQWAFFFFPYKSWSTQLTQTSLRAGLSPCEYVCVCVCVCVLNSVRETFTVGERDIRWERTPPLNSPSNFTWALTFLCNATHWGPIRTSHTCTHIHTHTYIHSRPTHKGVALSICGLCGREVTSSSPPVLRVQNKH